MAQESAREPFLMSAKLNRKTTIHRGRVFDLITENITLSNGATVDIDVLRHPGASVIVPLLEDNRLVLIKQYRHAIGTRIWEIPAGTLDHGETPLACAERELAEETGYSAAKLEPLGEIIPVPGYSDERLFIFLATNLEPVSRNLDEDELVDVHTVRFDDAIQMIYKGEIQDAKTIVGLFLAASKIEQL